MTKNSQTPGSSSEGPGVLCSKCNVNPRAPRGSWCRECRRQAQRDYNNRTRKRPELKSADCAVCGKEMTWTSGRGPDRVYCSKACKIKADTAVQRERKLAEDAEARARSEHRQQIHALAAQGFRECNICHEVKEFEEFHRRGTGYQHTCKLCAAKRHEADPENLHMRSWRSHLRRTFNMTSEVFDRMVIAQSGRCAICDNELVEPSVDHDHACCPGRGSCGRCVRALLCNSCNVGLGHFRDSVPLLEQAITYLKSFQCSDL